MSESSRPTDGHSRGAGRDKAAARALIGRTIAEKYRVIDVLGQGGFGTVYLVEITAGMVGEKLALKVLPPEFSGNETVRDQFLNEIRVAMRMVDKSIVQIRDVGTTSDGLLYYTMDYCDGQTLAQILRESGPLPVQRSILIILRVLRAVRTAHGEKIIHRDLKPANIMVERSGSGESVRVLDFGIATAIGTAQSKGISGSPHYMPPEQFLGEKLGFYSDLFAVGAILYELLTGEKPYPGATAKEVFSGLKEGPPTPPEDHNAELTEHPALLAVVAHALERNPQRRYQSAKDFFDDLNAILKGGEPTTAAVEEPAHAEPAARRNRRARRAAVRARTQNSNSGVYALVGIVAIVLAVGFLFRDKLEFLGGGSADSGSSASSGERLVRGGGTADVDDDVDPKPAEPERERRKPATTNESEEEVEAAPVVNPTVALAKARAALAAKDWTTILSEAGKVIQLENENHEALHLMGVAYHGLDDLRRAEQSLELARTYSPVPNVDRLILLATIKQAKKPPQWDAVGDLLQIALSLPDGKKPQVYSLLAVAYDEQNLANRVQSVLKEAQAASIETPELKKLVEKWFVERPKAALKTATKAVDMARSSLEENNDKKTLAIIAEALKSIEDARKLASTDEAIAAARTLELEMRRLNARTLLASSASKQGDKVLDEIKNATKLLDAADAAEGSDAEEIAAIRAELSFLAGRAHMSNFERRGGRSGEEALEEASFKLGEAINLAERASKPDRELILRARSWRGRIYAERGDYVKAEIDLKAARSIRDLREIYEQARSYMIAAEKTRSRATRLDALENANGRLSTLKKSARKLSKEMQQSLHHMLGRARLRIGIYKKQRRYFPLAVNEFRDARELGLNTPTIFRDLAKAYEENGDAKGVAKTHMELFDAYPTAQNCLLAADSYFEWTESRKKTIKFLSDALGKVASKDHRAIQKRIQKYQKGL